MRQDISKLCRWGEVSAIALALAITVGFIIWTILPVWASFEPEVEIILSDYDSDASAEMTVNFNVPEGDYMFDAAVVTYIPTEWGTGRDADLPDGTVVGNLSSEATLGLAVGAGTCMVGLFPNFTLMDATTEGSAFTDTGDMIGGTWNGYDDVGGLERAVVEYPGFLDDLFPSRPIARFYGHTVVTTNVETAINLLLFEPGASLGRGIPSNAAWGYASITQLNDNGVETPDPRPTSLADFCTPLVSNNTISGEVGGVALRTNPQYGGTYVFRTWARSLRDVDGDGLENAFDTCPYVANTFDPRDAGQEGDQDGIDPACDPDDDVGCYPGAPTGWSVPDCDNDGFQNRADNCPMVQNGIIGEIIVGPNNQADSDDDGIGDACDTNPATPDGSFETRIIEIPVEIEGPAPPEPGADTDGDGFDDATEADLGSCYTDDLDGDDCEAQGFGEDVLAEDSTPEDTSVAGTCTDEEDNDLDGYIDDVDGGCDDDTDGDGASDEGEDDLGSDPEDANSTPEDTSVAGSCTDGVDNDGDGDTDAADEGCAEEEVTPTPTVEAETPTPEEGTPTPTVEVEICAPVFPGTYSGLVRIDGQPAASGYQVTASVGGTEWGSAIVSGGRYAMDIPDHMPSEAPCFEAGSITFELNGMTCTASPDADWASGLHTVDLSCAPAAPPVTPEVTPEATPTVTPVGPPPTGAGGLSGSSPGLPVWAMALAGWAGLTIVAGLGTLVAARRR